MPLTQTFNRNELMPAYPDGSAKKRAGKLGANLNMVAGTVLAETTAASQSEVQTITVNGSPTGGTFTLAYNGLTTAPIAYNATAAVLLAAFVALANIGTGNATCTGSAGGPYTLTFAGALANLNQNPITANYGALTGGSSPTVTIAQTTGGYLLGSLVPYVASGVIAAPTVAPTLTDGATGTWPAGNYEGAYAYVDALGGETTPSPIGDYTSAGTKKIHFATISSMPAGAVKVNYYINGEFAVQKTVSASAVAAFDVDLADVTAGGVPPRKVNNTQTTTDGSQIPTCILALDASTDNQGRVTYSPSSSAGDEHGQFQASAPVYYAGVFNAADLTGLDAAGLALFGRLISGTITTGKVKIN